MTEHTWNYQIILHFSKEQPAWYGLHEVHYDDKKLVSWTEDAISFSCDRSEGIEGIIGSLKMALEDAKSRPQLIEEDGKMGRLAIAGIREVKNAN